ncbi:MAG: phosphotriesterase family protein [Rhodoglobus sp.]
MSHVQTVLGPVSPADLGRVMPHEHLFSLVPGAWLSGGDGDHSVALAAGALGALPGLGFGTVVDLSPYGVVGRDADGSNVRALVDLSERSGLHIVAGSAVYLESFSPEWARRADIDALTQRFIDDATTGIGDTGIVAGIYGEQATSLGEITPHEEKCLRALARAHSVTGLAIATHTTHATMAMEQVKILQSEGVALDRVVIGHMDTSADETEVHEVLEAGAHIAIDTIGKQVWEFFLGPAPAEREQGEFASRKYFRADDRRADFVARLVRQGWAHRILLAQDLTGAEIWMNPDTHGTQGYSYLAQTFIPLLRARGVSEEECEQMLRGNPARILTIDGPNATQKATL